MASSENDLKYYLFLCAFFLLIFTSVSAIVFMLCKDLVLSWASGLFIAGLAWIAEHKSKWGYLEFEIFGHETYGLIISTGGALVLLYKKLKK